MSRLAFGLVFAIWAMPLMANNFKATVPLLELKKKDGKWLWRHDGEIVAARDLGPTLRQFADYKDEETGWLGRNQRHQSQNILVLHVDSAASEKAIWHVLTLAREAGIRLFAIADIETANPPKADVAPVTLDLDDSYLKIDTTGAQGGAPVIIKLENSTSGYVFSVSVRDKVRVIADATAGKTADIDFSSVDAKEARKSKERAVQERVDDLVKAIELAIELYDGQTGMIEIVNRAVEREPGMVDSMKREPDSPAAWAWYDIAGRACAAFNENRGSEVTVLWPFRVKSLAESPDGYPARKTFKPGERPHEANLLAALNWLKDHQNREGFWSATGFSDDSVRIGARRTFNLDHLRIDDNEGDKGWEATCDVGLTGLALLAFAGAGFDHKTGDYRAAIRQGIIYLRKLQENDGCFGPKEDDHFVYNHAIAAMAMAELYGLSNDAVLKPIVDRAVDFILKAQNPGLGWRYGVQPGINDSSVTSWMVQALKSAKMAGCEFDSTKSYSDAAEWYKMVTVDVGGRPKTGYDSPGSNNARLRAQQEFDNNRTMDAIYATCMLAMGKADAQDETVKTLAQGCVEKESLPRWEKHKVDFYYWYYASLACFQVGGTAWETWDAAMTKVLLDHQRGWHSKDVEAIRTSAKTLDEHGSWDAVGAWGTSGGRVYSTAMGALILETSYRFQRGK